MGLNKRLQTPVPLTQLSNHKKGLTEDYLNKNERDGSDINCARQPNYFATLYLQHHTDANKITGPDLVDLSCGSYEWIVLVQLVRTWMLPSLYNMPHKHSKQISFPSLHFAYLRLLPDTSPSGLCYQYGPFSIADGTVHILPPTPFKPLVISDPYHVYI